MITPCKELINLTATLIAENQDMDINDVKATRKQDPNNFWNILCLKYFKSLDYNNVLKLYQSWHRKTSGFANQVNACLVHQSSSFHANEIIRLSFTITPSEWSIIQAYIVRRDRMTFNRHFSDFLSIKLQSLSINCWLKSKYNWFRKLGSQKSKSPYWSGVYVCIDPKCMKEFRSSILETMSHKSSIRCIVFVDTVGKGNHKQRVEPKIVCTREKRSIQADQLMIHKPLNCKTSNLLHNVSSKQDGNGLIKIYKSLFNFLIFY